jgi:phosphate transport system permease protein
MEPVLNAEEPKPFAIKKTRTRFLGLTLDETIQTFFGGNAFVAVIVLALITLFLVKEGAQFFTQNRASMTVYRQAGLEYVDLMRQQEEDHIALTRYLFDVRMQAIRQYTDAEGLPLADANARLVAFDEWSGQYSDAIEPVRGLVSELTDVASAIKTKFTIAEDKAIERAQLLDEGKTEEAAAVVIETVDFKTELAVLTGTLPMFKEASVDFAGQLTALLPTAPAFSDAVLQARMDRFVALTRQYLDGFPEVVRRMETWDFEEPIPLARSFTGFIFGRQWLTASFWQDWYGVIPLFVGSLMVSAVALTLAIPLGVGAAIYVNQIATAREQRLIKPCIEFIAAIPSVVLGFFGIAVLGEALRALSQFENLHWIPGFPIAERLNALTAGCLLALIAVPTIFTLAEDALNNVPRAFREASFALGATRLQTIVKITIPASLSGIVSAVLLGFGRVIGETMVVLLCAGNRIAIPDFTAGVTVFFQPVHTMTGIIAQEMGEVVRGSIHYRALFMVGLVLFVIALLINFIAQKIVRRYRISIG